MNIQIDHSSPIPLHLQVENLLRELIKDPDYQSGKLLPKEVDLAKRLGISRNTVRQATNKLTHEKLLIRKKGIGTRVATNNVTTNLSSWYSFSDEMHEHGLSMINFEIKTSWVVTDDEISKALELPHHEKVLKLERLRGVEKEPTVYFVSYFHPRVGLSGEEDFTRHLYEIIESDYSTVPSLSKEEIQAINADDFLADKLQVNTGSPVLFRKRRVYDPGGRPIEYNLGFYRAEKFTYSIDIKRQ
ncbi:MAG: GntR family transcriptional regulator [Cyclobacteriaceae bacterium]